MSFVLVGETRCEDDDDEADAPQNTNRGVEDALELPLGHGLGGHF